MEQQWDYAMPTAMMFLLPGIGFLIEAVTNVAKHDRRLTALGTALHLAVGVLLTAAAAVPLLGLAVPWVVVGVWGLGIGLVVMGTRRLYVTPPSGNLQLICLVGGIVLLAFLAYVGASRYF
jgi:hypothetical protein